jgi:hypothetical protein
MADGLSWLILAYRVPGEPSRLRAAVWRRLKGAGAVYLAQSVAALPASAAAERILRGLRNDIGVMGGSAQLLLAEAVAGEEHVVWLFNMARDDEYAQIIAACDDLHTNIESLLAERYTTADLTQGGRELSRLTRRDKQVRAADFFGASRADAAAAALARCRDALSRLADAVTRTRAMD